MECTDIRFSEMYLTIFEASDSDFLESNTYPNSKPIRIWLFLIIWVNFMQIFGYPNEISDFLGVRIWYFFLLFTLSDPNPNPTFYYPKIFASNFLVFAASLSPNTKPEDCRTTSLLQLSMCFFFIYKDLFGIFLSFSMRLESPLVPRVRTLEILIKITSTRKYG